MLNRMLWDQRLKFLMSEGIPEGSARSDMGKWVSKYQIIPTFEAVTYAQNDGTGDPIALVESTLRARNGNGEAGQYGGDRAPSPAWLRDKQRHDSKLAALASIVRDRSDGRDPWGDNPSGP
jgi:hypothetical protein